MLAYCGGKNLSNCIPLYVMHLGSASPTTITTGVTYCMLLNKLHLLVPTPLVSDVFPFQGICVLAEGKHWPVLKCVLGVRRFVQGVFAFFNRKLTVSHTVNRWYISSKMNLLPLSSTCSEWSLVAGKPVWRIVISMNDVRRDPNKPYLGLGIAGTILTKLFVPLSDTVVLLTNH